MVEQKYFWTDQQLREAVANSKCRTEVARALCPQAEPKILRRRLIRDILKLELDTSHWQGSGRSGIKRRRDTEELFVKNSTTDRSVIRRRILRANVIPYYCNSCKGYQWQGKLLSLHVDHINGDRTDNRLSNLRLLCPNCHSQTSTYAGKRKDNLTNRARYDILKAIETTHGRHVADQFREDI